MRKLEPQDTEKLQTAYGAIGSGHLDAARAAIAGMSPESREHPAVLVTNLSLCEAARDWPHCLEIVETLIAQLPENPMHWVQRSLYLRELGSLAEAREKLLPAAEKFPNFWMIHYHLAGLCCRLGETDEGRCWLNRALEMVDADSIKSKALGEPDFQPLWPEIRLLATGT